MNSDVRSQSSTERVSPFGHLRIKGCLPPPRSLSQAATSFIGSSLPSHPPYALSCFNHPGSDQRSADGEYSGVLLFNCKSFTIHPQRWLPIYAKMNGDDALHISSSDMLQFLNCRSSVYLPCSPSWTYVQAVSQGDRHGLNSIMDRCQPVAISGLF